MIATSGRETELKLAFASADDAERFRALLGGNSAPVCRQENHFFDTATGALNQRKLSCRLRLEADKALLTLKGPSTKTGAGLVTSRPEQEIAIPLAQAHAILGGTLSPLAPFMADATLADNALVTTVAAASAGQPFAPLGSFVNERTRVQTQFATSVGVQQVTVELDRTLFPGDKIEFEAEVETADETQALALSKHLVSLCEAHGIVTRVAKSKLSRFMATLANTRAQ